MQRRLELGHVSPIAVQAVHRMTEVNQFAPTLRSTELLQPLNTVQVRQRRFTLRQPPTPLDLLPK